MLKAAAASGALGGCRVVGVRGRLGVPPGRGPGVGIRPRGLWDPELLAAGGGQTCGRPGFITSADYPAN